MMLRRGPRLWVGLGGIAGAIGVAGAAAAAHGATAEAAALETSARILLIHAPALIAVAWLSDRMGGPLPGIAGLAFLAGLILFCGSLAARAYGFALPLELQRLAPWGGIALIGGWLAVALTAILGRR